MKVVSIVFCLALFVFPALSQNAPVGFDLSNYGVRIEPDKRVMIVLATLDAARTTNAAGESVPVLNPQLTPAGKRFNMQLRDDLAALNGDLRQRISNFVIQYKKRNPQASDAELIAPFISMAYALSPAPELADPIVTVDLPGSLLDVLDFAPLVRDFYRRSSFPQNLPDYTAIYQKAADESLRAPARELVSELLGYLKTRPQLVFAEKVQTQTQKGKSKSATLKNVEVRERERRFIIVPELLAPAGTVNFLNVKDDYAAILAPDAELVVSAMRRAYLQFVVDPLIFNNSKDIATVRDGIKKILDERRKVDPTLAPDVYLTISRSLVAAIDVRESEYALGLAATVKARRQIDLAKTAEEKSRISAALQKYLSELSDAAALQLSESYEKGALLAFYFAEQLKGNEDAGFDIASSVREMILSFDPAKEGDRLGQFADARKRALAARDARRSGAQAPPAAESPITARLLEIEKTIAAKDYQKAAGQLTELANANRDDARVFYNLGRVYSFLAEAAPDADSQKQALLASKAAYESVVRIASQTRVDAALTSLSYAAMAKIYEFFDDKAAAVGAYDKAIEIGDVQGGAFAQALAAKQRLIKTQ